MGKDYLSAYQRQTGRTCTKKIAPYGEYVLYRVLDNTHQVENHDARWHTGVWLGLIPRTNEDLVGTPEGVVKAYAIKGMDAQERWSWEAANSVTGVPWKPVPSVEGDHIPIVIRPGGCTVPRAQEDTSLGTDDTVTQDETQEEEKREQSRVRQELLPRGMQITEKLIEEFNPTEGCAGCTKIVLQLPGLRVHSDECRRRIQQEMEATIAGRERLRLDQERRDQHQPPEGPRNQGNKGGRTFEQKNQN